ncbi:MAG: ribonucleoside triphosphate reductase, partial [Clostridia bacterium]|nr:ribonucleoside triphosphate reductase [Clostridia bacterium]
LFEMTSKYGTPYFSHYINSDMEPSDVRSMCCRLRLDLRELRKKSGGFFGSGESTGSVGVVTINMPRIAYLSEDKADFYKRLDRMMDISARSLSIKRKIITKLLNEGLYPYTKRYLGTFENHFSTIGLIGMNEACLNARWIRKDLTQPEAQEFTKEVLNHMRERLSDYQEQYGDLYNLEATPAESTTYRLAKHDVRRYPDIITAGGGEGGAPYYTNSSHLPVGYTEDVFSALDIQDDLQTLYTSGTVFHTFLGEKLPDWKAAANLVRKIAENYKLPYYTMSPTYSVCKTHGYLAGEVYTCPHCGEKTEVYSRITGYYRPVQNWNDGKAQEFKERKEYNLDRSVLKHTGPITDACACAEVSGDAPVRLFATKTCPNCKIAAKLLTDAGIPFEKIYVEDNKELATSLGLKQAPTLIVGEGADAAHFAGVASIRDFIAQKAAVKA